ncbi:MAG: XdhC/CoxF family protein, partial [Deltaproteobacteria bacterium]|nr:XdhC/CoxF family protein [Deltaproteobacteria bacterium]
LTHKHLYDFAVLENCLKQPHCYVGMIGSKKKVATCLEKLRHQGVTEEVIETIHAPVGINIRANTPAEIAVSIAAQLADMRNKAETCSSGTCPSSV